MGPGTCQARSVTCSGASDSDCAALAPESTRACRSVSNCAWEALPWQLLDRLMTSSYL